MQQSYSHLKTRIPILILQQFVNPMPEMCSTNDAVQVSLAFKDVEVESQQLGNGFKSTKSKV